jgi:hypothetical protein
MAASASRVFDLWGVDSITLLVAIIATAIMAMVRWSRTVNPVFTRRKLIADFLNGSVIYPFCLLIVSVPDQSVFEYLKASRISIGLAGGVGIVFVIGELIASSSHEKPHVTAQHF